MMDNFGLDDDVSNIQEIQIAVQESQYHPLRIAAPVLEPYTYPCILNMKVINLTQCSYPGIAAEILHYALKSANLSYTLIPIEKIESWSWGTIVGRDPVTNAYYFDGLLGGVINGTYDTVMTSWGMTDVRMTVIDYTFPIENIRSGFGYIMRKPYETVDMSSAEFLFMIFPVLVWCIIGGLTISIAVFIWLSERMNKAIGRSSIFESFWRSLIMLFHQHEAFPPRTLSSTIVTVFGLLGLMFLHKIYEAHLVEQLAKQVHRSPFISMTELAAYMKLGQYQLITYDISDFYFTQVQFGEGSSFSAMRDALAHVPAIVEPLGLDKILEKLLVDPGLVLPGIPEINAPTLMKNRCDLMYIQDLDMTSVWSSFVFRRRAATGMAVSQAMASMIDFMVYIGEKYFAYQSLGDSCERNVEGHVVGSQAMKIEHYYGLIIVCIFFCLTSVTALGVELYVHHRKKKTATYNLTWPDFSLSRPTPSISEEIGFVKSRKIMLPEENSSID